MVNPPCTNGKVKNERSPRKDSSTVSPVHICSAAQAHSCALHCSSTAPPDTPSGLVRADTPRTTSTLDAGTTQQYSISFFLSTTVLHLALKTTPRQAYDQTQQGLNSLPLHETHDRYAGLWGPAWQRPVAATSSVRSHSRALCLGVRCASICRRRLFAWEPSRGPLGHVDVTARHHRCLAPGTHAAKRDRGIYYHGRPSTTTGGLGSCAS